MAVIQYKGDAARYSEIAKLQGYPDHLVTADEGWLEVLGIQEPNDDFTGDVLDDKWGANGDGTGIIVASKFVNNGVVDIRADKSTQNNKYEMAWGLCYKAAEGVLIMRAIVALGAITNVSVCIGLTDARTEAAQTLPFSGVDTPVAVATDAVMFMFDTAGTTNTHWTGVAVKAAAVQAVSLTTDPVATYFNELVIRLDSSGNADFYIDGSLKGSLASAVTTSVALCPYFGIKNLAANKMRNLGVDLVQVFKARKYTSQTFAKATTTPAP